MVEKSSGKGVKTLRLDNGGEYASKEFEDYLKKMKGSVTNVPSGKQPKRMASLKE